MSLQFLLLILWDKVIFTLKTYFEMILFTDFEKFEPKLLASTYEQTQSFGISSVASQFCRICTELLKFGLTGKILYVPTYSKTVNGRILFEEFHKCLHILDVLWQHQLRGNDWIFNAWNANVKRTMTRAGLNRRQAFQTCSSNVLLCTTLWAES